MQKSIFEMNDREYANYKQRRRGRLAFRNRMIISAILLGIMLFFSFSCHSFRSGASNGEDMKFKYYTVVSVKNNDTLWDIADTYMDYSFYADKNAYISEIVSINHLGSESDIRSGQKLTVPYYSAEFIK